MKALKVMCILSVILAFALLVSCDANQVDSYENEEQNTEDNTLSESDTDSLESESAESETAEESTEEDTAIDPPIDGEQVAGIRSERMLSPDAEISPDDKVIYIYRNNDAGNYWGYSERDLYGEENGMHTLEYIYLCETEYSSFMSGNGEHMIIYDGGFRYGNAISGEISEIDFEADPQDPVVFTTDYESSQPTGIILLFFAGEDSVNYDSVYYDIDSKMLLTDIYRENEYMSIYQSTYGDYLIVHDEDMEGTDVKSYIYRRSTGELVTTMDGFFFAKSENGAVYFLSSDYVMYSRNFKVYNDSFEPLSDEKYLQCSVTSDGNIILWGCDGDHTQKYYIILDRNGECVFQSPSYDDVFYLWKDIVCVNDKGMLKLIDKGGEELAVLGEWNDRMYFHDMLCGYYTKALDASLPGMEETEYYSATYKDGIPEYQKASLEDAFSPALYIVCENSDISYGTIGSGIEYIYDPDTGRVGMIKTIGIGGYAKPVLYLYPENECDLTISFEHPELLTVTYPEYEDGGWQVNAAPDGTLTDANGRSYYALYWEESGYCPTDFEVGFCVTADNAADFLEEKLDALGLSEREANEFIMYWLPVLKNNGTSLVYFETTESREIYNKLNFSVRPDSLLRIAIHIKKIDQPTYIREQILPSFEREGFAAIEWGGVIY